ncbi:hypothetical protein DWY73_20405 [Bacteroides fragilis]|uniref:Uncharacterized protein n=2 Tax=Bacteroides fragilis TaxID=817 RepID=A0A395WM58_BACFG|nr:hypothetical protein F3B36_03045 [Bacteroides fragilis]BAD47134.1 hypothetical protein BF0385 [Bacteroides fragilis YCH46]KAA4759331.1 hypothetical protein F3B25_20495 [Bacteroides fragilis]KAA4761417.1 hypothetical protein F3B24_14885 [Bacteroides fragilis]KAA4761699.1 hypothetical protein F3B47_08210 [Bacteroides fragilis]
MSKTLFTTDYTDYHRLSTWIINDLELILCYSVSSVVSFDTRPLFHLKRKF